MMTQIKIRNEVPNDYRKVEEMTRKAFWNLYVPGCSEHYIAHVIRNHEDFIHELDLVIELDGEIIGNIMYTKTKLVDEQGNIKPILTFGPICVAQKYQRQGFGKQLIEYSFHKALELGYDCVVIFGSPMNYVTSGFKSCLKHNVCLEGDVFPAAMLVKELKEGVLDGRKWYYYESPAFAIDSAQVDIFDATFEEKLEKNNQPSQEEFYIMSHARLG